MERHCLARRQGDETGRTGDEQAVGRDCNLSICRRVVVQLWNVDPPKQLPIGLAEAAHHRFLDHEDDLIVDVGSDPVFDVALRQDRSCFRWRDQREFVVLVR